MARIFMLPLIAALALSAIASAETTKVEGLIIGRSGVTMIVQTSDSPNLVVLLTDATEVGQLQGVFQARKKDMSMAALIPGLAVQVEGTYDDQRQLVAKAVSFKGNDLERAQAVQAGLRETQTQTQQNQAELEKQNAMLQAQKDALRQQQQQLNAQQEKVAANKASIEAAMARFGQLDDYYILDEVTVRFGNGKVTVDSEYEPQLLALAEKARTVDGYMIEIVGYASSSGSATLNQSLSEDRANNVANLLSQRGRIPLTNLLAPGAMGETRQVGDDTSAEGQAENRRVVVRVLQNKGIAAPL